MRRRPLGYPLKWMCLGALFVAAVVSCEAGTGDPADRAAERAEVDPTEPVPGASPADAVATLRLGDRLNRQQLVQLLGDRVPAGANEPCTNLGQVCAAQSFAPTTSCNYTDMCDTDAQQNGVFVDFKCTAVNGNAICMGFAQSNTVTVSCSRVTSGLTCVNARCDAPFCLAYSGECAEQTTQVRNCFSAAVCSNGVCGGQTMTQQAVGSCQRETTGSGCSRTCPPTQVATCNAAGSCACGCPNSPASFCPAS